jgi:predicted nucleic acid-binding protein
MKLRVYLDTSVFSAYFDARVRDRQEQTEAFWTRRHEFELATSELAREELLQARDVAQRQRLVRLLKGFTVYPVSKDMEHLGQRYVDAGVFTSVMRNDAVHVAVAVLTRQNILLSWNFRHLVNRLRRAKVNEVNVSLALPTIEILAPPEL